MTGAARRAKVWGRRRNDSRNGLGASVLSKDTARAEAVARRIGAVVGVNDAQL